MTDRLSVSNSNEFLVRGFKGDQESDEVAHLFLQMDENRDPNIWPRAPAPLNGFKVDKPAAQNEGSQRPLGISKIEEAQARQEEDIIRSGKCRNHFVVLLFPPFIV